MNSPESPGSTPAERAIKTMIGLLAVMALLKQLNVSPVELGELIEDATGLLGLLAAIRQLPPDKPAT